MQLSKLRSRLPKTRYRFLLLLLPLFLLHLHRPHPTKQPNLPIHQICLTSCPTTKHTTTIHSSITLTSTSLLPYLETLPAHTIIYLTSSCIRASPNSRELLYLALLHHNASTIVPAVIGDTLDSILPLVTRASTLRGNSLSAVLRSLSADVLELPSARAESSCNHFKQPFDRSEISVRSSKALPKNLLGDGKESMEDPIRSVSFSSKRAERRVILFVMPWLQMGGSEQTMLRLGEHALSQGYTPAYMVLQPFWGEIQTRLTTRNDWMNRAYALTSLVYDVVNLVPYHQRASIIRYVLEIHRPKYVITANSRLFYNLLPMVKFVLPDVIIADYTHMVHEEWLGGGMPRYAANHTTLIDRHFTASENVTNSIRGWIKGENPQKVRTCYIGADVKSFPRGIRKWYVGRRMRSKLGIGNDKILVLFAGRFVLDKGVDVLVEVINRIRDPRFAFLLVGSGGMEDMILGMEDFGRVVIRPGASDNEMGEYYAASDVLLLPSVKEGIALVLYEAMANGLLVITTDVGGQKELVTPDRGVLLDRGPTEQVASHVETVLNDIPKREQCYKKMRVNAERVVRTQFSSEQFVNCVFSNLSRSTKTRAFDENEIRELVKRTLKLERRHGEWALRVFPRSVASALTVVQVGQGTERDIAGLVERYENVSVVKKMSISEAADVDTEIALILPTGYNMDDTDLQSVVNVLRRPIGRVIFDLVGMRIGDGSVGKLSLSENGIEHCMIKEELFEGGTESGLKSLDAANVVEIQHVYAADVMGEVFLVRTESLRSVVEKGLVNEGSDSGDVFRVAKLEGWNVGYVHDVVVEGDGMVVVKGATRVGECNVDRQELLY